MLLIWYVFQVYFKFCFVHSQFLYVVYCDRAVRMWWLYLDLLVALVAGYKTVYQCQYLDSYTIQRFSRAGPRGREREWATQGVHPLSWLLSNNRLEEVCSALTKGIFSSRLLLSNQDKGCTSSVAHSLPLPLGPALLNLSSDCVIVYLVGAHVVTMPLPKVVDTQVPKVV